MLIVKVLGPGCENCQKVEGLARKVISSMGMQAKLIKVTDWTEIKNIPSWVRQGWLSMRRWCALAGFLAKPR